MPNIEKQREKVDLKNILNKLRTRVNWGLPIVFWVVGIPSYFFYGEVAGITVPIFWTVLAIIMALMKPAHVDIIINNKLRHPSASVVAKRKEAEENEKAKFKKKRRKKTLDDFFKHK